MRKKTKEIIRGILLLIAVMAVIVITYKISGPDFYVLAAEVVDIDRENDLVYVADATGNMWSFYGVEDWQRGDIAALRMYNNGTSKVYDDKVVEARYSGRGTIIMEGN